MFVIGIDLASRRDFTAASVVRSKPGPDGKRAHICIHLDRWRGKYPETVDKVAALANTPSLRRAVLVCDQTGVGSPVVDALRDVLPGRRVIGANFTSGNKVTKGAHRDDRNVPKALLVAKLKVLLGERRFSVSNALPLFRTLQTELQAFQMKRTEAGNDTYGAARERDHDDLVSSLMLACWLGESVPGPVTDAWVRGLVPFHEPASAPARDGKSAAAGEYVRSRYEALAEEFPELLAEG